MSDEVETQTPETPTEEAVPETPALTNEQIAAALGVDVASLDRLKNLDGMAKEVMREKSALGRAKKAEADAPVSMDDEPDLTAIDPNTRKLLKAFIEQEYGPALSLPSTIVEDEVNEAIESFMDDHKDVTPEALGDVIAELEAIGAGPKKPTKRATREFLKTAYDLAKSRSLDTDTLKKQARDEVLAELAAEAKDKGDVVAIEKKRGVSDKVDADKAATELGFWERIGLTT